MNMNFILDNIWQLDVVRRWITLTFLKHQDFITCIMWKCAFVTVFNQISKGIWSLHVVQNIHSFKNDLKLHEYFNKSLKKVENSWTVTDVMRDILLDMSCQLPMWCIKCYLAVSFICMLVFIIAVCHSLFTLQVNGAVCKRVFCGGITR